MSDSQVVIQKFEIPPTSVFKLEMPEDAWILKIVASKFNSYGCKFPDGNPVPFMWVLLDMSEKVVTRTFVRIQGRTRLSELDAAKLESAELIYVGTVVIPRKDESHEEVTYFIFEDESERAK